MWGTVYRGLNILVIVLIIVRWITPINIGLYIVLALAALLIVGLLDSMDCNALRENRTRHIFDFVILLLFMLLEFN